MSSILADQWPIVSKCGGRGELWGLSQWVQLCTWSPNKLWRSNSIFNLCCLSSKTFAKVLFYLLPFLFPSYKSLSFLSACFLSVIPVSLFPLCHSCQPVSSLSFLSACFLSVIPVSLFPLCHSCQPVSSLSFLSACFLSVIPVSLFPLCHSRQPVSSLSYTIAFSLPFIPQSMLIPLSYGQSLFGAE